MSAEGVAMPPGRIVRRLAGEDYPHERLPAAEVPCGGSSGEAGPTALSRRRAARQRSQAGALGDRAGLAAEFAVADHYGRTGRAILVRRWRGRSGEVDLVARDGDELVFVEVKKSRDFDRAAARVTPRQVARLFAAAAEYLAGEPLGQDTPVRFDVALVDAVGRIEVLENALAA